MKTLSSSKRDSRDSEAAVRQGSRDHRSKSPRVRVWDPAVGEEEKARRKTEREETNVHLHGSEEPVLIIKKKEVTSKLLAAKDSETPNPPSTYLKKTANPRFAHIDYDEAKKRAKELNHPKAIETVVVQPKPSFKVSEQDRLTEERVTKISGTEFLPRGFLELEPMLLRNEFEFVSRYYEEAFAEDQRRTKEVRRKQYGNRHLNRVRDFVIYKIDYIKAEVNKILKKWFDSKNSRMPWDMMCQFAEVLKLDPDTFKRLHDAYNDELTSGKTKNNAQLNEAIFHDPNQDELRNQSLGSPEKNGQSAESQKQDSVDSDRPSKSKPTAAEDAKRRAEILAGQKAARLAEAKARQQTQAESQAHKNVLAQSLLQKQEEVDAAQNKLRKTEADRKRIEEAAKKLQEEKDARERDMRKARREASKEKDKYKQLSREALEFSEALQKEREERERAERERDFERDERLRLQNQLEEERFQRDREEKELKSKARRDADRHKREAMIEAEVIRERAARDAEEAEARQRAEEERIRALEEENAKLQRLHQKEQELRREQLEREEAEDLERERARREAMQKQKQDKRQLQRLREEDQARDREEELRRLDDLRREMDQRRQQEEDRQQQVLEEQQRLQRERDHFEQEKKAFADELKKENARREELAQQKARSVIEEKKREAALKKKDDPDIRFVKQPLKSKPQQPDSGKKPAEQSRPARPTHPSELEEDESAEDPITLATLDYDLASASHPKPHRADSEDSQQIIIAEEDASEDLPDAQPQRSPEDPREVHRDILDEALASKRLPEGVDRDELWRAFLAYCKQDLPRERDYQKLLLALSFERFISQRYSRKQTPKKQTGRYSVAK